MGPPDIDHALRNNHAVTASPPRLLVADDEAATLELVARGVQSTGFITVSHTSARDALAMLAP